jgi:3-isopropylmalate/(R)-2-methylmalate dehydratase small subunit
MRRFETLTAVAAPLPLVNVDTDKILPARFLKTIRREGLGNALFHTMRFDSAGRESMNFILNRLPWRNAQILIAGDNFGCGSSREHAPWALTDFGFRCLIAPSFADIFCNNCIKNGLLPITLQAKLVERLLADSAAPDMATLSIDLPRQRISRVDGLSISFDIAPERKRALLLGLDDIAETLQFALQIAAYESLHRDYDSEILADVCRSI